jgi:hypothetical protein
LLLVLDYPRLSILISPTHIFFGKNLQSLENNGFKSMAIFAIPGLRVARGEKAEGRGQRAEGRR